MLCLDGSVKMRHSIHSSVDTYLKSAQNLILRDIGHFIPSTKFKIGLQYSSLVKLAQSLSKMIHVTTVNDGFNIGTMKI